MILTQTTLMNVEINEIRSTINSGDSSFTYIYIFWLLNSYFFGSSHPEVLLGEGVLEVCSESMGSTRAGMRSQ